MFATLERATWALSAPFEVNARLRDLTHDFGKLKQKGFFPQNPMGILDIGSGSGAGSVALRATYPHSPVTAVDSAGNWQSYRLYKRRKPPSDITFYPTSIEHYAPSACGSFDLAIAARISWDIPVSPIDPWVMKARAVGQRMLTMLQTLGPQATLAMSWPADERGNFIQIVRDNLQIDALFESVTSWRGSRDEWVIWKGFRRDSLPGYAANPDTFLTPFAKSQSQLDPYGLFEE